MRILDLSSQNRFEIECRLFRERIENLFLPDLIVGIATGGEVVAKSMGLAPGKPFLPLRRQRKSTEAKVSFKLALLLKHTPLFFNNTARILEIYFREIIFNLGGRALEKRPVIPCSDILPRKDEVSRILVIDDAVDSGATFIDVIDYLQKLYPDAEIFSAALSQTFKKPAYTADFIMHDRTLVRGPWALDAQKN